MHVYPPLSHLSVRVDWVFTACASPAALYPPPAVQASVRPTVTPPSCTAPYSLLPIVCTSNVTRIASPDTLTGTVKTVEDT